LVRQDAIGVSSHVLPRARQGILKNDHRVGASACETAPLLFGMDCSRSGKNTAWSPDAGSFGIDGVARAGCSTGPNAAIRRFVERASGAIITLLIFMIMNALAAFCVKNDSW
jgi:hypothetical protein